MISMSVKKIGLFGGGNLGVIRKDDIFEFEVQELVSACKVSISSARLSRDDVLKLVDALRDELNK